MFNIYTNHLPIYDGAKCFVYADDLCITAPYLSFARLESTLKEVLFWTNAVLQSQQSHANPEKTHVTVSPKNKEEKRSLKVMWNDTELDNTAHPKYLDVTVLALCYSVSEYMTPVRIHDPNCMKIDYMMPKYKCG